MNKLTIIGNLTKDPELRTTTSGKTVCDFTVAVNRRFKQEGQPEADFFRVSVWNEHGKNCAKYLAKGRKVCVIGPVSVRTYTGNDGTVRASLEINSPDEVEFLSSAVNGEYGNGSAYEEENRESTDPESGYGIVDTDELPF